MPYRASRTCTLAESYSATVVCTAAEIRRICEKNRSAFETEGFSPELFLASIDEATWRPRVVVVTRGGLAVGVVYAKERKLAGFATGLVYVDTTLGGLAVSNPALRSEVLEAGLNELYRTPGVRGLRVAAPFHGQDLMTLRQVSESGRSDFAFRKCQNHSVLPLPITYEAFLEGMGSQTRRNCRYYRRQFEAMRGEYVPTIGLDELESACAELKTHSRIPPEQRAIARAMRLSSAASRPLAVGLRLRGGKWMGVISGWVVGNRAFVFMQVNRDAEYPRLSLSLVLRSYMAEALISAGIREMWFWAGVGGAFARYANDIPTVFVYLDKPSWAWRSCRRALSSIGERVGPEFKPLFSWIAAAPEPLDSCMPVYLSESSAAATFEHNS